MTYVVGVLAFGVAILWMARSAVSEARGVSGWAVVLLPVMFAAYWAYVVAVSFPPVFSGGASFCRRTAYAVTDRRVICVYADRIPIVRALRLEEVGDAILVEGEEGVGTITFFLKGLHHHFQRRTWREQLVCEYRPMSRDSVTFLRVADARAVRHKVLAERAHHFGNAASDGAGV